MLRFGFRDAATESLHAQQTRFLNKLDSDARSFAVAPPSVGALCAPPVTSEITSCACAWVWYGGTDCRYPCSNLIAFNQFGELLIGEE